MNESNKGKAVVSVITVCYNAAADLEKTMKSVREQTYGAVEYVIVDGGSSDGTRELIERNSDIVSRWVSERDEGLYFAMNKGLDLASGEYVLFMNAGDLFYESETLEKMMSSAYELQDIYYGDTMILSPEGVPLGRRRLSLPKKLTRRSFHWGMTVCHQSFLVRRELCSHYDTSYSITADYDWVLSAIERAEEKKIKNTGLFVSCFSQGGISSKHVWEANCQRFKIMRKHYGLPVTIWFNCLMVFRLAYTYCKFGRM